MEATPGLQAKPRKVRLGGQPPSEDPRSWKGVADSNQSG